MLALPAFFVPVKNIFAKSKIILANPKCFGKFHLSAATKPTTNQIKK